MWIAHALLKWFVFTIPGFGAWLADQGLPATAAWPVFLLELVGALALRGTAKVGSETNFRQPSASCL